ncbi:MAG TPA: type IV pilin protein [Steroidobacteraceae bacterium]|nr:type IV pilin protein [Steroidobacteraceae bacterium]
MAARHRQRHRPRRAASAGFTLVELMVVVIIASVLVAIAIPSYIDKVRKSRRTEAKTALLDLAGREERYYNTNNAYTNLPANLGYGAGVFPLNVGSGYYQVTVAAPAPAAGNPPTYTITATPLGDQIKDAQCQQFQLTNSGLQTSAPNLTACWQ